MDWLILQCNDEKFFASIVEVILDVHLTFDHPSAHHNYVVLLSAGTKPLHIFG